MTLSSDGSHLTPERTRSAASRRASAAARLAEKYAAAARAPSARPVAKERASAAISSDGIGVSRGGAQPWSPRMCRRGKAWRERLYARGESDARRRPRPRGEKPGKTD